MKISIFCRVGMHRWFTDAAMFTTAQCCNRCGRYQTRSQGERLQAECQAWDDGPDDETYEEGRVRVLKILSERTVVAVTTAVIDQLDRRDESAP